MEEACFSSPRKRTRKRSYTRKATLSRSYVNMAEARREIVNALQLHRSSSAVKRISNVNIPSVLCGESSHGQSYYRQLTDSMPVPEPTWSTTAPAVLCAPVPAVEVLELAWFDNVSSSASYAWWLGFLNSLDGKRDAVSGSEGCGPCMGPKEVGKSAPDVNDQSPSPSLFTDEWLVFPAGEERGEQGLHFKDI